MRLFEVILLISCTSFPILIYSNFFLRKKIIGIAIISIPLILHIFLEGLRWQMIPGYLLIFFLSICLLRKIRFQSKGKIPIVFTSFIWFILLVFGWALPTLFPVFKLPIPSGDYQVGSQYLKIVSNRLENITEDPEDKRAFMVKVWYPAIIGKEEMEAYLDQGNRLGFSNKFNLPHLVTDYFDYIKTNTYHNPLLPDGKFPVLIFSHGSNAEAFGYYALIEEIVSHGYIVFNINHTYESSGSLFPDGEIKLYHAGFDQKTNDEKMREMAWNATQDYTQSKNETDQLNAVQDLIKNYVAAEISLRWSKDISELIDHLVQLEEVSFFFNHLDLSRIGVFGHSQGGSAIGQSMLADDRIKAGINLDGVQWGQMIDSTINNPFLLVSSDWDSEHLNLNKFAYRNLDKSNFKSVVIKNTGHSNFMDIPMIVNLSLINEAGQIDPLRAYEIISNLILNFFDDNLMKQKDKFEDLKAKYPEIQIVN